MSAKKLRELLKVPGIIRAPGAGDPWTARLIEMAGFPAVYMSGAITSHTVIGRPDIGLLTMTEMALQAKNISNAVDIPVIADGDNGHGGVLNVIRMVEEYERAGVAAIQLEDQVLPKRCGHMEGKEVIPKTEMVSKIKAAVYARRNEDFVVIARTDARAVEGFDSAIERALAYCDAGADVIFFEAPQSRDEMEKVAKAISKPLLANMVEGGKTPFLKGEELDALGFKIVIYPGSTAMVATKAIIDMLDSLKTNDTTAAYAEHMLDFANLNKIASLAKERELEKRFQ
ncbi:oxaloacetate decarboxylase [Sporomusa aerivorans]|uniref:isocitrate lyase/PEP mutase family protein n=1 Tax=Sporomusa aerivorans TaxID=204936 RepID=UPI00352BBD1A